MRDFFIRGLEVLINVFVVIAALGIVGAAVAAVFFDPPARAGVVVFNGPLAGVLVLVGGFLYLVLVAGFMYLGLGIYQNTRRMAEALDRGARP